jgi:DNA-binding MarR family transcriptional regulator
LEEVQLSKRLLSGVGTWLHLFRATQKILRRVAVQLEPHGLTLAQFDVLAQLQRTSGILQQELADRLFVTKGNIVGLLNRMERDGLVVRQQHPQDGRAHLIYLTDRGKELATKVVPEHEALISECMALLSPNDQRTFHELLRTLDRALGSD